MKIKRIISVMLAVVILSGALVFSSNAAGSPTGNERMEVTINSSVAEAGDNDIVTFYLNIKTNFHATNMRWPIMFDSNAFELVGENGEATAYGSLASDQALFEAVDRSGDERLYPDGYRTTKYGLLLIHWVGGAATQTTKTYYEPTGLNCVIFKLRVKEGSSGTGKVFIPPESTLFYNQAMNDPHQPDSIYRWNLVVGSTLILTPAQVNLGALDPGIARTENAPSEVIIEEFDDDMADALGFNGYIYGFPDDVTFNALYYDEDYYDPQDPTDLRNYFNAVGGATMIVTPSDGGYGTGTLIEIYFSGIRLKAYYIVILGDLTGDCFVDDNDLVEAVDASNGIQDWMNLDYDLMYGTVGSPYKKACDMDCDTAVDLIDVTNMELYYYNYITISQTCSGVINYI